MWCSIRLCRSPIALESADRIVDKDVGTGYGRGPFDLLWAWCHLEVEHDDELGMHVMAQWLAVDVICPVYLMLKVPSRSAAR
jgi:hypothetical protein